MAKLFDSLKLRGITLRNRIGVSPMVQISSSDGFAADWHLVHLGARAAGGAGLVMTEATAVEARGRISINDLGIWKDEHVAGLRRITEFIHGEGAVPGIQLGHGGRKASYAPSFDKDGMRPLVHLTDAQGAWPVIGASAIPFDDDSPVPTEMTQQDIDDVLDSYATAAQRANAAGFDWIEVHAAHGYLPHCFYSPISNVRDDRYGGTFENRVRFTREIAQRVREVMPNHKVLAFRLSHTDWIDGGWTTDDTIALARLLKNDGVDVIDVSSGGSSAKTVALMRQMQHDKVGQQHGKDDPVAEIPLGPGYQVPGAEAIRQGADIPVAAVGMITEPAQANDIVEQNRADIVLLGRAILRNPNWPQLAAIELGETKRMRIPVQYYLGWKDFGEFAYKPVSAPTLD
ncbi:MAG: NADH:flavin oxidoreductase/NADH oxidase [Gammaproteobacteria bacterium]|nr:NADH:flavin oxidoreductase/NADH oxidase [Gammaproteobacteria bacterium]